METYEWQKNKAVVDRLYYSERILVNSTLFAGMYTACNLLYIQKNYFASTMKARIPKVWTYWAIGNAVALFVLAALPAVLAVLIELVSATLVLLAQKLAGNAVLSTP